MRSMYRGLLLACSVALAVFVLAGCQTLESEAFNANRLTPAPTEYLRVDQIMILADVTGSTGERHIFPREKELLKEFTRLMPDMNYEMGFNSFAGLDTDDWTHVSLDDGNPIIMSAQAHHLEFVGGLTPLEKAVRLTGSEFNGSAGRAVLVVFSDGRKQPHEPILEACKTMAENHHGPVCIYTVNVGYDEEGRMLLEEMAKVTGCGKAWQAIDLETPEGMEAMVREIFFGERLMEPMEPVVTLLGEVLFDLDKDVLKPEGKAAIDLLVTRMKSRPDEKVIVEGHTCDRASDAYNMDLSQRRANAVAAYMVQMGIDQGRIRTQAFGESRPAVPNTDEAHRKLNRRAEFRFGM